MIRQSSSHGNLADDSTMDLLGDRNQVKRTKSFWKFGKSDTEDIVEGMAMWKHRDLIQPESELYYEEEKAAKESTLKRNKNSYKEDQQQQQHKSKTMERKGAGDQQQKRTPSQSRVKEMQQNITVPIIDDHAKYQLTKSEIDQRVGKTKERYYQEEQPQGGKAKKVIRDSETELGYAEDEDDMLTIEDSLDEKPINNQQQQQNMRMKAYEMSHNLNNKAANNRKYYDEMELEEEDQPQRFYDDESIAEEVMVMKTVKRKEILKQYYSSGTSDTERHSSSSDPYDCIVVQDHHLMRNKNNIYNSNSNTNNRKNNKNKEMTTFRSEFALNKKNLDLEKSTILPRTKLVKGPTAPATGPAEPGNKMQKEQYNDTQQKKGKKEQNVDPKASNNGGKRKNFEESKRNSLSSAKSYGPWYDLWGANANGTNNNTLISQK